MRPFVPFSRAGSRPESLRQLPHGWTLEETRRADRADRWIGRLCAVGLAALVAISITEHIAAGDALPVIVTANK